MNAFLQSLKADLLDRRLLPFVGAAALALAGAVAYALLSGGGSSPHVPAAVPHVGAGGIAVSQVQSGTAQAVAETTDGASQQRHGFAHNPFAALPGAAKAASAPSTATKPSTASTGKATTSSTTTSSGSSSSSSSASGSGSSSSSPSGSSTPAKSAPAKPKTVYQADLSLGEVPPGNTQPSQSLKALPPLSAPTPLPSKQNKLVEFMGVTVTSAGKSATFAVAGEVILRGEGSCLPSATQCKLIELKEGKSEQLEYVNAAGQPVAWELRLDKIAVKGASAAAFGRLLRAEGASAHAGSAALLQLAGMRYSLRAGVIVFTSHRWFVRHARRG